MASGAYSFIDIAVLDEVRSHFAAGDPLVVFSRDLDTVLWANGPGAKLLGFDDVEPAMGSAFDAATTLRRQIAATSGFPDIGKDRLVTLRIDSGLSSRAQQCRASAIGLPDGQTGIMLAVPGTGPQARSVQQIAARAISGFSKPGHFAALLDAGGNVVGATPGFRALTVSPETLKRLVEEVRSEHDRLIKRMIGSDEGEIGAGIARLIDDPAMHLLIVVAEADIVEPAKESAMPPAVDPAPASAGEAQAKDQAGGPEAKKPFVGEAAAEDIGNEGDEEARAPVVAANDSEPVVEMFEQPDEPRVPFESEISGHSPDIIESASAGKPEPVAPAREESDKDDEPAAADGPPADIPPAKPKEETVPAPVGDGDPVRFVWRTDAEGRFSAISDEFIAAVGPSAAGIIGERFVDVARTYGFDDDGEIAALLQRRDTWSGRSIGWPLEGTGLVVPVDLAALPAYSRDREFQGFRGFGVLRLHEAHADPRAGEAAPAGIEAATADPVAEEQTADETFETRGNDPFLGEKPAITIADTPGRRQSDKVISLAEHQKEAGRRGLSENEELAFREIGKTLKDQTPDEDEVEKAENTGGDAPQGPDEDAKRNITDGEQPPADGDDGSREDTGTDDRDDRFERSGFIPSAFAASAVWPPAGADISVLNQLPVAVLIRSGDELHYANPEFLTFTGYRSINELSAAGGFDVLFEGPEMLEDGEGARHAMRLIRRDGTERLCSAHLRSVTWDGRRALMLAIRPAETQSPPMDGTGGIEAGLEAGQGPVTSDEVHQRIEELRSILDTATDGVVLVAPDGTIRSLNRPAEALFGFDAADVHGKPFTALFAVESQRAAADYLAGLQENGVASVLNDGREVIGREAQGRFIPLFMTMGKLPGAGGFCAVMRDITQWKRAEEELTHARGQAERASSQKTGFLARVSHEIRTPLNAIIGFSELMIDEKFGPIGNPRYRDYLRDINRSGNHVLDLVNDLLDISKIEAGEQEMNFEAVSLNDAIADGVAMMQPEANSERVIIRSSFASNLPEVVADLRSVKQIALNLLSNAIRFTPAGGQVIVSTAYDLSGDVVMRVRDTGIGMSRTEVEQALKPFRQVSSLKHKGQGGTGLGLPLTKAMVEANRAKFFIESTPDEGTIVEITFPSTRVLAD